MDMLQAYAICSTIIVFLWNTILVDVNSSSHQVTIDELTKLVKQNVETIKKQENDIKKLKIKRLQHLRMIKKRVSKKQYYKDKRAHAENVLDVKNRIFGVKESVLDTRKENIEDLRCVGS